MVKLVCVFVGLEESLFFVNIDANESVGYLKDAIKEKKPWTVTGVARKLHLFLAKKDSAWLDATGVTAVELDANGQLQGFEEMRATRWIRNAMHFGEGFHQEDGQIHVLVVVPKDYLE
ncbi:hypothetical protein PPTG_01844 [Phytophthora nicotianae INRA-310]|uniref:Crinkler effector protein N-terminal domain-containing protein n=2 Tax=Phytophthora nicotianae TaxID=4792 RepID=W2R8J9_PHYN3|nr:hypothetical protein PPTG_01844 [Phytophthora nicotianae INRA-310]ETN21728.1 hypothetical protein PPTG_01844 [Phytophthora nicotianae INRA-310]ETO73556.1 hypothetical protein F444_10505 [Phytophthora nicotianae P1976]